MSRNIPFFCFLGVLLSWFLVINVGYVGAETLDTIKSGEKHFTHATLECAGGRIVTITPSSQDFFTEKDSEMQALLKRASGNTKLLETSDRSVKESVAFCKENDVSPCKIAEIKEWGQKWDRKMSRKIYAQIIILEEEIKNEKDALCSASVPKIQMFISTQ